MLETEKLAELFPMLDEAVTLLKDDVEISYIEALTETLQNLTFDGKAQQLDGLPSDDTVTELNKLYRKLKWEEESREVIRKLIQFGFIKAIREDKIQTNHQVTPDAIAFLIAYFVDAIKAGKNERIHMDDLAAGSGNLLMVVMNHLEKQGKTVSAEAVDNDDLLITLASNSAYMQQRAEQLTFTHSDSLQELLIEPADVAVADLPVGYYPLDDRAEKFETSFEGSRSYAHFLLIEQHVKYLKESGWGFLIVPKNIFESDEKGVLMKWLKGAGYLQAMLNLPESLFQSKESQKSILIIQKHGQNAKQAEPVLLGTIPELKNARKMQDFVKEFNIWSRKML